MFDRAFDVQFNCARDCLTIALIILVELFWEIFKISKSL
jgi:hypothetical protein